MSQSAWNKKRIRNQDIILKLKSCLQQTDLISSGRGLPGGLLEPGDGLVEPVRLGLEGLHLLPDGVHGEAAGV